MVEYIKKTDFKATTKDKIMASVAIVVAILIYFQFFHVDKTPEGYQVMSPELTAYLKSSEYYKETFNGNKKIVLFYPKGSKIQYPVEFSDSIQAAKKNPEYNEKYVFLPFETIKNNALFDIKEGEKLVKYTAELKKDCRSFCIVNPTKGQLYFYYAPSKKEAENLTKILDRLQYWGLKMDKLD